MHIAKNSIIAVTLTLLSVALGASSAQAASLPLNPVPVAIEAIAVFPDNTVKIAFQLPSNVSCAGTSTKSFTVTSAMRDQVTSLAIAAHLSGKQVVFKYESTTCAITYFRLD